MVGMLSIGGITLLSLYQAFDANISERLPHAASEMTFSYMIYILGWMFGIVLVSIIFLFLTKSAKSGSQLKDHYARGIFTGMTALLAVQFV
ncbi:hypothetical protein [Paenibacillus xylaniclasticus]|uniref:hypothetical protein n=1 Tax=Paenibacillus xylaniclasticus TaxID=588083 RepID=UPI000FD8B7AB|nr:MULTISPECIES: hypothetical protein [Paenibacillus]GFN33025.1 hypothetical protein PCURB6_32850 [Paenibacillus curdlanolyticus]